MTHLLSKDSSIKVLTVINGEAEFPHCYTARCTDDLKADVELAFKELLIKVDAKVVEDVVQELIHGRVYWYDELYCFDIIDV